MKILACFPTLELLEVAALALESKLGAEVLRAPSEAEGLRLLGEMREQIQLVVIDGRSSTIQAFAIVEKSAEKKLPYICCLQGEAKATIKIEGLEVQGLADYAKLAEEVVQIAASVTATSSSSESASEEEQKYCRIGTNVLLAASPLDADMYIKLSATKFVRLFQSGDAFDQNDLARYYEQKKVAFLHILKSDTQKLIDRLNAELSRLIAAKKLDLPKAEALVEETVDTIHEIISQIGVTPEVEELVGKNIDLAMKAMGDFPELGAILKRFEIDKDKYIPAHSMLCANLACSLAVAMEWVSDSTFQKLTMAAMLHDVGLKNHNLCAVKSLADLEKNFQGKFSTKEVQEYKAHPKRAATLVSQFKEIGAEVDKVVLQHHEHPMGSGFPDAINASYISPLSSVFIVAHDMVDWIYDHDGKIDMEAFIVENETKLSAGNFKKVLKGLLQMAG